MKLNNLNISAFLNEIKNLESKILEIKNYFENSDLQKSIFISLAKLEY